MCQEPNPHTPSQRHRCACGQVCQIMSSLRLNFSFTHTFNPLPFTSRFLFLRPLGLTAVNSPPAAAKRAPARRNAHICQELSIADYNLSCLNNSSLLLMQWYFAGMLMVGLNWGVWWKYVWKIKPFKHETGIWMRIEEQTAIMNLRNARLSCISFPPLCVSHTLWLRPSEASLWNYCFLPLVLFVCSPCLALFLCL